MPWIQDKNILAFEVSNPSAFRRSREALKRIDKEAFDTILNVLRFYREADNEEDRHLQNAAKRILYITGSWIPENEVNLSTALRTAPILVKQGRKK
jgi:DNA primase large subunit